MYLALGAEICLGEILRHVTPNFLPQLNGYRLSELAVRLTAVLDCRNVSALGLRPTDLWHDSDCFIPRALAAAAILQGVEGMIVPSATRLGDNLIIFPELLRENASLEVVGERDPALYVPQS